MKVLIVNCERGITNALCIILRTKGYDADGALTGQEALAIAREQQPDWALLTTNNIPDIPADEVVLQLIEIVPRMKFLFFSGSARTDFVDGLLQRGLAAEVKPLPFHPLDLMDWLRGESALRKIGRAHV